VFTSPVFVVHFADSGHRVWIVGQTVHVPPVLSGHSVTETDAAHFVGRDGQCVVTAGQMVCVSGQTVTVPEPSSHTVMLPVQIVCCAGHFVTISGQVVGCNGQIVGLPVAAQAVS